MIFRKFYNDLVLEDTGRPSIFLAGPTSRYRSTQWRLEAVHQLMCHSALQACDVFIPELQDDFGTSSVEALFDGPLPAFAGMSKVSANVLEWESQRITTATVVLFWMPFTTAMVDDPLPGLTTRAEVSREIALGNRDRVVLGMPSNAVSGSHIRYWAHKGGFPIYTTLEDTVNAAVQMIVEKSVKF